MTAEDLGAMELPRSCGAAMLKAVSMRGERLVLGITLGRFLKPEKSMAVEICRTPLR